MPVFNGSAYLRQAIDSVLAQTFSNFEFIIIDDGSTDSSASIIKKYTDKRIRVFKNSCNRGLVFSLNFGLSAARGKYLARMDADDISLPNRLFKQLEYLEARPTVSILVLATSLLPLRGYPTRKTIAPAINPGARFACGL